MRKFPFLAIAAVSALALTGCAASTATDANAVPCTPSGEASDAVNITGDSGAEPTVEFTAPLTAEATQRTVVEEGAGAAVTLGDSVQVSYSVYNATSGEQLDAYGYDENGPAAITVSTETTIPGVVNALNCSTEGSRVVAVIPPADAWGDTGQSELGVAPTDSLIFVLDVGTVSPTRANGVDQPVEEGYPTVALADNGAPTVTIPDTEPPTDLKVAVLKKGDGAVVAEGNDVTVQYQGVLWATGEVFDQSWGRGISTFNTTGVIQGFGQGMVGQTVGSQVLIVIPPALGYGDAGTQGISGTDTLVFVVDILGAR